MSRLVQLGNGTWVNPTCVHCVECIATNCIVHLAEDYMIKMETKGFEEAAILRDDTAKLINDALCPSK